jgi:hypothetical protein
MSSREGVPTLALSLDELNELAESLQEDLQRQANQGIRKKDWEQGIGALAAIEAVREFIRLCEIRVGMYANYEAQRAEKRERRKPGSNLTALPAPASAVRKRIKTGVPPEDLPGWARERVK